MVTPQNCVCNTPLGGSDNCWNRTIFWRIIFCLWKDHQTRRGRHRLFVLVALWNHFWSQQSTAISVKLSELWSQYIFQSEVEFWLKVSSISVQRIDMDIAVHRPTTSEFTRRPIAERVFWCGQHLDEVFFISERFANLVGKNWDGTRWLPKLIVQASQPSRGRICQMSLVGFKIVRDISSSGVIYYHRLPWKIGITTTYPIKLILLRYRCR